MEKWFTVMNCALQVAQFDSVVCWLKCRIIQWKTFLSLSRLFHSSLPFALTFHYCPRTQAWSVNSALKFVIFVYDLCGQLPGLLWSLAILSNMAVRHTSDRSCVLVCGFSQQLLMWFAIFWVFTTYSKGLWTRFSHAKDGSRIIPWNMGTDLYYTVSKAPVKDHHMNFGVDDSVVCCLHGSLFCLCCQYGSQ
jgi:hypothetical protein